ncbi:prefoldin subunit 6 [Trichogramma pretiosum]|uniref:prefoldin subunit 6 n=1 Tax=Trichogramma pretiosum TaxID=7493 RepID=UPI0006C9C5FA|nr:prefoldin subunit 6 [Trichogramma pretiosum]
MTEELQKKLQSEIEEYKQVQKEYQKLCSRRQQLDSQLSENTIVDEELKLMKPGNEIYKLVGPILIKQDPIEAKENVKKRLEFINSDIKRTEEAISSIEKKQEVHRNKLEALQVQFQKAQMMMAQKAK